jgi:methionyl-tRNA synthetase
VAEIAAGMKQMQYPRAAEQAWQVVALELGYVSTRDPFEVATEGKSLARWVRRNR